MVNTKKEWIESHKHLLKGNKDENVYIYGNKYSVVEKESNRISISRINNVLYISKPKDTEIRSVIIQYLKALGGPDLKYLTHKYSKLLNKEVNSIRIKDVKTRWGSCSSKNNINYSVWLLGAPKEVIEYVVIHEVCHLVHMNHSKMFWDLVGNICPKYKEHIEWLHKNGFLITL